MRGRHLTSCAGMRVQVKANFRPEFVNRVDEFVVFEALKLAEIRQIVRLQAKRVEQRLAENKIKLELTEQAVDYLAVSDVPLLPCAVLHVRHTESLVLLSQCISFRNNTWSVLPCATVAQKQV